jgi:hypothetical protein
MSKKYNITSVSSVVPLVVYFKNAEEQEIDVPPLSVNVTVDYQKDKVHFDNPPPDLDTDAMEKQILDMFKPPNVEIPEEYYEYFKQVQEVRSGNYASSFMSASQIDLDGGNNDGR